MKLKRILACFLISILIVGVSSPLYATTRYVKKTGSDSGDCSNSASPCLTIHYGFSQMVSGDHLEIYSGTYAESMDDLASDHHPPAGTSGNPSVVEGATGETVILTGINAYESMVFLPYSYITLNNLEFDGGDFAGTNTYGLSFGGGAGFESHDIILTNLHIHNMVGTDVLTSVGIFFNGLGGGCYNVDIHNVEVDHFTNNGQPTSAHTGDGLYIRCRDSVVYNSSFHDNTNYGMQAYSGNGGIVNLLIYNNSFYNNGLSGATLADGSPKFYNNLVYNNDTLDATAAGIRTFDGANGVLAANNTVYGNGVGLCDWGPSFGGGAANTVWENNISYNNSVSNYDATNCESSGAATNPTSITNLLGVNPSFVNAGSADFHILSGSAARGFATNICSTFCIDKDGVARPAAPLAWDAGAYQFNGAVPPATGLRTNSRGDLIGSGSPVGINCVPGDGYRQLDATAGHNLWICTTANTWTQQ